MTVTFFVPPLDSPPPPKKKKTEINNNLWNKSLECNDLSTGIHPIDPMKAFHSESNDTLYTIISK